MNHHNITTRAEALFVRFRSSGAFILSVIIFIATWVLWNVLPFLPHFDDPNDFGHLNLILSMEATIATVLLMRDNARSRVREMEILRTIQESVRKLSQIEQGIDDIQEDVGELTAEAEAIAEAA
jgi:uncharacterized membrane protein